LTGGAASSPGCGSNSSGNVEAHEHPVDEGFDAPVR